MDAKRNFQFTWAKTLASQILHGSKWNNANACKVWSSEFSCDCVLVTCYDEREKQAELKMLNLLLRGRECGGNETFVDKRYEGPSDAEIIFGDCPCERLMCSRQKLRAGWGSSRVEWLWELERRQQLQQAWHEQEHRTGQKQDKSTMAHIDLGPKPITLTLQEPVNPPEKQIGCWSCLRNMFRSNTDSYEPRTCTLSSTTSV